VPFTKKKTGEVDVVVVGAGFSGLYLLYKLRRHGFTSRVFERGGDVGGTWYWNRYPGARCDVESMQYSYSFDEELQQEWHWPEKFSAQPDILAYANHVADRYDLRKDIEFNVEVKKASFDEKVRCWEIETGKGEKITTQYFIMATGCISTVQIPKIPGLEGFKGEVYHTGNWPHKEIDFSSKRIAVVGVGSSGIQSIPVLAEQARHLTVFQRTPNYSIPSQNEPMTADYEKSWKSDYASRRDEMRYTPHGSLKDLNDKSALSANEEERQLTYQKRWEIGGAGYLGAFNDLLTNIESNDTASEFVREKIREIVKDPVIAEKLSPKTYPIGTKRICIDSGYFETFNRENVELVDINEMPIEKITSTGLLAAGTTYRFDAIIFATGFDAMTGSIFNVEINGRDRKRLKEKWSGGPRTYLGLMTEAFPNLFMITGPGSPSVKSNMIMSIEQHVDFVLDSLIYMRNHELKLIEPQIESENKWVEHVQSVANQTLFPRANSWYMGANIPGKPRLFMPYIGGVGQYRRICEEVVTKGYDGFKFEVNNTKAAAE
jgi:cyclohexanone monooxygenase